MVILIIHNFCTGIHHTQLLGAQLSLHPGFLAQEFQPKTLQRAISSSHYKRITEAAAR